MGYDVHLHVAMNCGYNDPLAALARRCLESIDFGDINGDVARYYLQTLAKRTGNCEGWVSLWAINNKGVCGAIFCEILMPFWEGILLQDDMNAEPEDCIGCLSFEHILVFECGEQGSKAKAYEILLNDKTGKVEIREHDLPFSWSHD